MWQDAVCYQKDVSVYQKVAVANLKDA